MELSLSTDGGEERLASPCRATGSRASTRPAVKDDDATIFVPYASSRNHSKHVKTLARTRSTDAELGAQTLVVERAGRARAGGG
jgi:hypothetical protein